MAAPFSTCWRNSVVFGGELGVGEGLELGSSVPM